MTTTLTPADFGLPEAKFPSFREHPVDQLDIATSLSCSPTRFDLLSAATGTGKSLIYILSAILSGRRVLVLVSTKGLQDQLMADFSSLGARDVRGQGNYRCLALNADGELSSYGRPGTGCDEGPCRVGVECSLRDSGCLYYDAVAEARRAPVVITNYAYWLTLGRYSDPDALGSFDLLVMDEAHCVPDGILPEFCAINLDRYDLKSRTGIDLPQHSELGDTIQPWAKWARGSVEAARTKYKALRRELKRNASDAAKSMIRVTRIGRELSELANADKLKATNWITQPEKNGMRFSPVWGVQYAERWLFRHIPHVLLTSATLSPFVAGKLGLIDGDYTFRELDGGFHPSRRPFYYLAGSPQVNHRMKPEDTRLWQEYIDVTIDGRLDRKGIIQPRSYARARHIAQNSRHRDIMFTHGNSRELRNTVAAFRAADPPAVLVSPSVEEGFDFPGDDARYQIIAKVPFPDMRSPLMQARKESDSSYPYYLASLALTQMAGRSTRSEDDWSETFIVDGNWTWFSKATHFPAWFRKSWKWVREMPEVPPLSTGPKIKRFVGQKE